MNVYQALLIGRIRLLERRNAAFDEERAGDLDAWDSYLRGYDEAMRSACDIMDISFGQAVMDCDTHYINQGVTRSMCGGVFLARKS